jgi:hypothetical protein
MIEHQREKQYVHSLIADLESDQAIISQHISHLELGILRMDTVIHILNAPSLTAGQSGQLYYLARIAPRLNPLTTSTRTYEQLKNSGNFRLIRNINVSNNIMSYYEKFPLIRLLESVNETEFNEYKKVAAKIFNAGIFLEMEVVDGDIRRTVEDLSLRSNDPELFHEMAVFALYMSGTKKGILHGSKELQTSGRKLIEFLKKEYHLN